VTGFFAALEERVRRVGAVCVGLDPGATDPADALARCRRIIDATAHTAAAFKPNAAFFEALGPPGFEALIEVTAAVPEGIPVILDAKRGDIASSAAGYARAAFGVVGAGAVTVSPYLGEDALAPFLEWEGRGLWVLCHTSNPGADAVQGLLLGSGVTVAAAVARLAAGWAGPDRLGLVVGATKPEALAEIRSVAPAHWILAPGVGAQGAQLSDLAYGLRQDRSGLLVTVSRLVAESSDPAGVVADLAAALRGMRPAHAPSRLAGLLHRSGCIRLGEFTLRSGIVSPIYADLRALTGDPATLRTVARSFVPVLAALRFDRLAPVPYGALPLGTAVALAADAAMVWPRPQPKDHGTGARVEGPWEAGDRVVLIDDVITSGASALEAATLLRDAGLVVEHLVVLVDRDPAARAALEANGIALHAITTLADLVADLASTGAIAPEDAERVTEFLAR
jgi:uridine monophosphate synthetase